jgi:hypothetical protein
MISTFFTARATLPDVQLLDDAGDALPGQADDSAQDGVAGPGLVRDQARLSSL